MEGDGLVCVCVGGGQEGGALSSKPFGNWSSFPYQWTWKQPMAYHWA